MNGGFNNCANADADISVYDTTNSAFGHAVEQPPANDTQLGTIAGRTDASTRARPRSPCPPMSTATGR